MPFWNEDFYFERRGDRFVYRPTVFSAGYDVSASEKELLFQGLSRLNWHSLWQSGALIALAAGAIMSGPIETREQAQWFLLIGIVIIAALAATFVYRRERLTSRVLGGRTADVPRLPLRQALTRRRPIVGLRYAIAVLRGVVVLFGLTMVVGDLLVLYLPFAAYRAGLIAEGAEEIAAVRKLESLTSNNAAFWLVVGIFNAVLLVAIVGLIRQVRRLRTAPGNA